MARFPKLQTGLTREFQNSYNEGVDKIETEIDDALGNSSTALSKATNAETNSTDAKNTANSVQEQFNQVVIEGDSSVEAAQARVKADATSYPTLQARLNATDAELAHLANSNSISILKYKNLATNIGLANEDWLPAIKQAVADVKALGGGSVVVPWGRRRIIQEIILPSNVALIGFGESCELWSDVHDINIVITETNAVNVVIRDLKLVGSGYGKPPANIIDEPNVTNSGNGIVLVGAKNSKVFNCLLDNHGGDGTSSDKNGTGGIWLTYGCEDCIIQNNTVTNCRNGINEDGYFGRDSKNNTIISNYVADCRFGIATETDYGTGCKIIGNTVKGCAYGAVDVNRSDYVLIQGNVFEDNGLTGQPNVYAACVTIYGSSSGYVRQDHVMVDGNIFKNNHGNSVKIAQFNFYSVIKNNQIIGGINRGGILVQGSRYYSIQNNEIVGCNGTGIHANETTMGSTPVSVDSCDISGNLIVDCTERGINLEVSGRMVVSNNRIFANGTKAVNTHDAIRIFGNTKNGVIEGNIIDSPVARYGIWIDDTSTGNIIKDNNVISTGVGNILASGEQYIGVNGGFRGNKGATRPTTYKQGMDFFDTTLGKNIWLKTEKKKEVASIQMTSSVTTSGNIGIVLDGVTTNVAVTAGETAIQVATKIRSATFTGWTTGGTAGTDTVTFTANVEGVKTDASYNSGGTGTLAIMNTTAQGALDIWVDGAGTTV